MFKKLMVLALVLSLASAASALNVNFLGPDGADWDVASNWATGSVPGLADNARPAGFNIAVSTSPTKVVKIQYRGVAGSGVTIASGAVLSNAGSFEHDNGTGTTLTQIDVGGVLNACDQSNARSDYTAYKLGRAQYSTGHSQLTVNGTLNVQSGAYYIDKPTMLSKSELLIGMWGVGMWSGSSATLSVGATGVVNADDLIMNTNGAADCDVLIDIATGGKIVVLGQHNSKFQSYRAQGLITGNGTCDVGIFFDGSYTTLQVPEPMTIALLGLGGLALLRKRR